MANTWIAPQRFLMAPLWWMWLLRITLPVKRGYSRVRSATTSRSIQVTVFCFELLAIETPHAPGYANSLEVMVLCALGPSRWTPSAPTARKVLRSIRQRSACSRWTVPPRSPGEWKVSAC